MNKNHPTLNNQISINNSDWKNVTFWQISDMDYEWYYILNTTTFPNGEYYLSIKAVGKTYGEIVDSILIEIKD